MPYYKYILYSEKFNKYYIGSSENIGKKLEKHNAGATASKNRKALGNCFLRSF